MEKPLRLVFDSLPEILEIPREYQNKRVELILWPLENIAQKTEDNILSFFGILTDFPERASQGDFENRISFE
ncbi:MAG: hypothetical protein H7A25_21935 [Leptospiraceae bacterium]|nr:hypothetical protein [Leptospiraceae bacterium]